MKSFLVTLLLLLGISFYAQNSIVTDYCEKDLKTKYDSIKRLKKLVTKYRWTQSIEKSGLLCFTIANRCRLQKDTLYARWYYMTIDILKKNYVKTKKSETKQKILFMVGACYYYINDYESAKIYLSKGIACRVPCFSAYYYMGVANAKQKHFDEAVIMFREFEKQTSINVDDIINNIKQ
jgi:tetratricopeptide (TPR) repeat protein